MSYNQLIRNISPSSVLGAAIEMKKDSSVAKAEQTAAAARSVRSFLVGLAGGVAGAVVWKRHRWLGFFSGHSVGANATYAVMGGSKVGALCGVGTTALAVASSLHFKRHPVLGYLGGGFVGDVATSFVPGSPSSEMWSKYVKKG